MHNSHGGMRAERRALIFFFSVLSIAEANEYSIYGRDDSKNLTVILLGFIFFYIFVLFGIVKNKLMFFVPRWD